MATLVDLNADVGESYGRWTLGDDAAVLALVTSANVACGFHAGDPTTLSRTCERAAQLGVAIGAQVSYPDLAGFGRRFMDIDPRELTDAVIYQIGALDALARVAGSRVTYVKPHGALYNAIVHHEAQAHAVADAVARYEGTLPVMGLPGSAIERAAHDAAIRFVPEGFADRAYTAERTLVPRREPGAVHTEPERAASQAVEILPWGVRSICVHGDSPNAAAMLRAVRDALVAAGAEIAAFAPL